MKASMIGFGYWGKILKKYIDKKDFFELTVIYDKKFDKKNGIYTNNLMDTLKNDIDIVFICSPVFTHYRYTKLSLENNKHVFCEKPLHNNIDEVSELYKLADKKDKFVQTDYTWLNSKSINKIKEIKNEIGQVEFIYMSIKQFGKFYKMDNVYEIIGTHLLSILFYLFPKIDFEFNFNDFRLGENKTYIGDIIFSSKNITGKISVNLYSPYKERKVILKGDDGIIYFNPMENQTLRLYNYKNKQINLSRKYKFNESNNIQNALEEFKFVILKKHKSNREISTKVSEVISKYKEENR